MRSRGLLVPRGEGVEVRRVCRRSLGEFRCGRDRLCAGAGLVGGRELCRDAFAPARRPLRRLRGVGGLEPGGVQRMLGGARIRGGGGRCGAYERARLARGGDGLDHGRAVRTSLAYCSVPADRGGDTRPQVRGALLGRTDTFVAGGARADEPRDPGIETVGARAGSAHLLGVGVGAGGDRTRGRKLRLGLCQQRGGVTVDRDRGSGSDLAVEVRDLLRRRVAFLGGALLGSHGAAFGGGGDSVGDRLSRRRVVAGAAHRAGFVRAQFRGEFGRHPGEPPLPQVQDMGAGIVVPRPRRLERATCIGVFVPQRDEFGRGLRGSTRPLRRLRQARARGPRPHGRPAAPARRRRAGPEPRRVPAAPSRVRRPFRRARAAPGPARHRAGPPRSPRPRARRGDRVPPTRSARGLEIGDVGGGVQLDQAGGTLAGRGRRLRGVLGGTGSGLDGRQHLLRAPRSREVGSEFGALVRGLGKRGELSLRGVPLPAAFVEDTGGIERRGCGAGCGGAALEICSRPLRGGACSREMSSRPSGLVVDGRDCAGG